RLRAAAQGSGPSDSRAPRLVVQPWPALRCPIPSQPPVQPVVRQDRAEHRPRQKKAYRRESRPSLANVVIRRGKASIVAVLFRVYDDIRGSSRYRACSANSAPASPVPFHHGRAGRNGSLREALIPRSCLASFNREARLAILVTSILLALIGLYLGIGGGWLIALGGSWYYLIAG